MKEDPFNFFRRIVESIFFHKKRKDPPLRIKLTVLHPREALWVVSLSKRLMIVSLREGLSYTRAKGSCIFYRWSGGYSLSLFFYESLRSSYFTQNSSESLLFCVENFWRSYFSHRRAVSLQFHISERRSKSLFSHVWAKSKRSDLSEKSEEEFNPGTLERILIILVFFSETPEFLLFFRS